jgi:hypothetical protein
MRITITPNCSTAPWILVPSLCISRNVLTLSKNLILTLTLTLTLNFHLTLTVTPIIFLTGESEPIVILHNASICFGQARKLLDEVKKMSLDPTVDFSKKGTVTSGLRLADSQASLAFLSLTKLCVCSAVSTVKATQLLKTLPPPISSTSAPSSAMAGLKISRGRSNLHPYCYPIFNLIRISRSFSP